MSSSHFIDPSAKTAQVVRGACPHDCPDTCALLTTVVDGKALQVRGDPNHPFTRGALCAKVRDYQQRVYSRHRVLYPLRRSAQKGAGEFERISWDEALGTIADRFDVAVNSHGPQSILPCSYLGQQGLLNGLHCGDPFFNRLGASIGERTFCNAGASPAYNMILGPSAGLDPESFVHAKLIILWACNVVSTMPHHWPFILEARRSSAKVVVIDPLVSRTARHADWHLRPRPGTDSALALGLIHVLFEKGLVDIQYIDEHTSGAGELKQRAASFSPSVVAQHTGIEAADIVRLAEHMAHTSPVAIRVGVAIERSANGPDAVRAISALPALLGAWKKLGGGLFQNSARAFPIRREALACPKFIKSGTRVVNLLSLGAALSGEMALDPPINVLFVYNVNPVSGAPAQRSILAGLARDDLFTVVSEQFITDTARFADIVLPAATQLEQTDLMYAWGHFYLTLNTPAIAPVGEAIANTELFRRLSRRMAFTERELHRSDDELMEEAIDWDHPVMDGISIERLRQDGYARLNVGDAHCRRPHEFGGFETPSKKCEFVSSVAAKGSEVVSFLRQGFDGAQSRQPIDPLPNYEPREHGPLPLVLISPKSHSFLNSCYANLPRQRRLAGSQTVSIHPVDAAQRSISDGELVQIFNDLGEVNATAHVTTDTLPGVVVIAHGYWLDDASHGRSVNVLNPDNPTLIGKAPSFSDTRVDVQRATEMYDHSP